WVVPSGMAGLLPRVRDEPPCHPIPVLLRFPSPGDLGMTQIVSEAMASSMEGSSLIRRMFEEGARLKAQFGAESVHDFSLGNPMLEPPARFKEAIFELLRSGRTGLHRYIPNAGLPEVR